jgi:hypothetical protein
MAGEHETVFEHPHRAFSLRYPAEWESQQKEDGRSCGFGPRERDDVGIWFSVFLVGVDAEGRGPDPRETLAHSLRDRPGVEIHDDRSLQHPAVSADCTDATRGGQHWLVAGGDVVLFATSEFPPAERSSWEPVFARLMQSLRITHADEALARQVLDDVLGELRRRHPEQQFR